MIEIKNIHKSYGSLEVLKGIDAVIEQGEIVSIVGASGAGKTTLLQIVGTLDKPDCGEILYDGRRVDNLPDREMARFRNGNIGFVFQFHQLLPHSELSWIDKCGHAPMMEHPIIFNRILMEWLGRQEGREK